MLLVKTYLGKSRIHGIGLFVAEPIKKGRPIWKFVPGFDFTLEKNQLRRLPKIARKWIHHFCYYSKKEGGYVVCVDDARFFNHSENPNTENASTAGTFAKRDIKKGEELTANYFEFDSEAKKKLQRQGKKNPR